MTDPAIALQTAIYTALDAAMSCPVYDHVPQGAAYPYVVIESVRGNDADFINARKERKTVTLSVWSTYRGQKEVLNLLAAISTALHGKKLTLSVGRMASTMSISTDTNREPDGVTYMGQARATALIEHG